MPARPPATTSSSSRSPRTAASSSCICTSLTRAIARCGAVCNSLPAGGAGEDRLEKYIADNLPPWSAGDFAPLEAAVIDEDTYVEQGRDLERTYSLAVINFILGTLQPDTDLAMVGYPFTDEVSHQFMGLVVADRRGRQSEPVLRREPQVRRRPVHRHRHGWPGGRA